MSLIQFHILLISISIFFGAGFGIWEMVRYAGSSERIDLWTGIASFAASGGFSVYLAWFLRRLKRRM